MLIDVLKEVAAEKGDNLDDAGEKNLLIFRLNKAAEEIHIKYAIRESLDEKVFDFDQSSQQVALPEFIAIVRGMRWHYYYGKIETDSMKNRYHYGIGSELYRLKFRQIRTSPLQRELSNESILTLSIPLAETTAINVTVAGRTQHSTRDSETLTFSPGETEKSTTLNFLEVEAITKDRVTKYDVTIKDVDDNVICVLPNVQTYVRYRIFQITDLEQTQAIGTAVEVLYSENYKKVREDTDTFWGSEAYDRAVFHKYMELYGVDEAKLAGLHYKKCEDIIKDINESEHQGMRELLNFKPPVYFNMPYGRTSYFRRGITWD